MEIRAVIEEDELTAVVKAHLKASGFKVVRLQFETLNSDQQIVNSGKHRVRCRVEIAGGREKEPGTGYVTRSSDMASVMRRAAGEE